MARIDGVVLAGGLSRRMGGNDKGQCLIAGRPMIEWVVTALQPQVQRLVVNSNRPTNELAGLALPVIADRHAGHRGPLMGLYSAMQWLTDHPEPPGPPEWLALCSCDTPFLPDDVVRRLHAAATAQRVDVSLVTLGGEPQPTLSLWHVSLLPRLQASVEDRGVAGFKQFLDGVEYATVELGRHWHHRLVNVNTPAELEQARQLARESSPC